MSTSTESPVLAGPPGDCCTKGVKHFGNPVGKIISIADVPTYLSEPPANVHSEGPKKVVLFFADIFGPLYVNARLVQDYYASHGAFLPVSEDIYLIHWRLGYYVLGIDYFFGDAIYLHHEEPNFDKPAWLTKQREKAKEITPEWIEEVRKIYGKLFLIELYAFKLMNNCRCGREVQCCW